MSALVEILTTPPRTTEEAFQRLFRARAAQSESSPNDLLEREVDACERAIRRRPRGRLISRWVRP